MDLVIQGEVIPRVRLVIFDKDGTLIDVHAYWANMVKFRAELVCRRLRLGQTEMAGIMDSMGVDVQLMRIKPEGPVGLKRREIVLQAGVDYLATRGFPHQEPLLQEVFREVDELSLGRLDELIRPLEGLEVLLGRLKRGRCRIALATTDRSSRAALALRYLGVLEAFDFIAGADMVGAPKPAPDIVMLICQRLGVAPERAVMVGDSVADVQSGVSANCLAAVGVETGLASRERLLAITPHVCSGISAIGVRH